MTKNKTVEQYCINCGKMFFTSRDKKFCSDECEEEYSKERKDKRICIECGKEFVPKAKNQKFCSLRCANKNQKKENFIKECSYCGKEFKAPSPQAKYCSEKCRLLAQINPDYYTVFYRDHFRCRYCGKTPADDIRLTIDHVYPKSKGGKEHKFNLVTACQECNSHKGATKWSDERIKEIWWQNKKLAKDVSDKSYEDILDEFKEEYPNVDIPNLQGGH